MTGIEVSGGGVNICYMCGKGYGRAKGNFLTSYSLLNKGKSYMPICMGCLDKIYAVYAKECDDIDKIIRQMCRKLDIYFNQRILDSAKQTNTEHQLFKGYVQKINSAKLSGKSYDDTLREEGCLWDFDTTTVRSVVDVSPEIQDNDREEINPELIEFWGSDLTPDLYEELDRRYNIWTAELGSLSQAEKAIYRQICMLEVTINRDTAAGKSTEKNVNALNSLLGSANLKPAQRKSDDYDADMDNTPFGVWIRKWENTRPVPEPDPELKDVDGIVKYITVWFFGHLCKMLGVRNSYCKLYEDEIEKLKVQNPEYEDDDDDTLLNNIFGKDTDGASPPVIEGGGA